MTLRALVTRPEEDAAPLAAALAERGVEVTVEPLLRIQPIADAPIDLAGVQALLFTSANGVRSFAALAAARDLPGWRELPAFAVGDASANVAREAGFARVESAGGDIAALAALVRERLDPQAGALFHAAGSAVAGDLAGLLAEAGFTLRREMLYEARPAEALSPPTVRALAAGAFDLVLFFSPRTAATFVSLARAAGEGAVNGCAKAAAVCLSPAVATAAGELPWREVQVAARAELPALLELIDNALAARARGTAASGTAAPDAEPTAAEPVMTPPPARRSRLGAIVLTAAVTAAVVALAGELLRTWWGGSGASIETPVADPATTEALTALTERMQTTETALARVQEEIAESRAEIATLQSVTPESPAVDATALEQRLAAIEQQIADLRAAERPSMDAAAGGTAALAERIAALESQIAVLEARPQPSGAPVETADIASLRTDNAKLRNDLSVMQAQLAALDQAVSARGQDTEGVAFVLAVGNLGSALATARPFAAELSAAAALADTDPALAARVKEATAALAARADRGIPTLLELRTRFPQAARAILDAAKQEARTTASEAPQAESWYDRPLDWVSAAGDFVASQVSVRPVGDVPGDDPGARVARAEVRLAEDALAAAVVELEGLTGDAATAAAGWLDDARARLAADAAVTALQAAAVTRLGATAPAAPDAGG